MKRAHKCSTEKFLRRSLAFRGVLVALTSSEFISDRHFLPPKRTNRENAHFFSRELSPIARVCATRLSEPNINQSFHRMNYFERLPLLSRGTRMIIQIKVPWYEALEVDTKNFGKYRIQ